MRISPLVLPGLVLYGALLPAGAQQTTDRKSADSSAQPQPAPSTPPAAPSGTPPSQGADTGKQGPDKKAPDPSGTSKDRLFYGLPNFLTLESAGEVRPLTTREKFTVVTKGSFDYIQLPWYGFLAGLSQAKDSEEGYGQGAAGYGKRFGANFADGTIENYMTGAILPSLLRQDPRFFQSGQGSFLHRAGYSIRRIVVTRGDSGHSQFNFSEVSAARSLPGFRPTPTIRGRIAPWQIPQAFGARKWATTPSPSWSRSSGPTSGGSCRRRSVREAARGSGSPAPQRDCLSESRDRSRRGQATAVLDSRTIANRMAAANNAKMSLRFIGAGNSDAQSPNIYWATGLNPMML